MSDVTKPATGAVNAISTAPAKGSFKPLAQCKNLQEAFETREIRERIADAVPKHMDGNIMLRTFVQAASKAPLIYQCEMRQALGAFLSLSYLGLTPGTALQLVHLIPFRSKRWDRIERKMVDCVDLNVIIGYPGYLELAHRSGLIRSVHCDVVLPGEHFRAEHGSHKVLEHRPEIDRDSTGLVPRAAYAFVHMAEEGDQFEVMPWADVMTIRNRSQAFRTAQNAKDEAEAAGKRAPKTWTEAPWVRDEREMAKKTPFRRLAKWLPKCPELRAGVALEESQDRGRLNYGAVIDGTASPFDGIPEMEDDPPPVDPGTAHGIRGSAAGEDAGKVADPPATKPATRAKPTPPKATVAPPVDKPTPVTKPAEPIKAANPMWDFEAVLIDAIGEPGEETFTDRVAFARAFLALWRDAGAGRDALREHNADAIEDASSDDEAARILDTPVDEPEEEQPLHGEALPPIEVVAPPVERGRVSWPSYVKLMKQAMANCATEQFGEWAAAQRESMMKCPFAQRVLIVRAISENAGMRGVDQPTWLGEAIRKPEAAPLAAKPAEATKPAEGPVKTADERWVDNRIGELADMNDRVAFDQLIGSAAVRTMMARLRRENRVLFDKADAAFSAKHRDLPIEPDDGGDPGPDPGDMP